jgi:hypothetical protein
MVHHDRGVVLAARHTDGDGAVWQQRRGHRYRVAWRDIEHGATHTPLPTVVHFSPVVLCLREPGARIAMRDGSSGAVVVVVATAHLNIADHELRDELAED